MVAVLLAVNVAACFFYTQVDLTRDKRYTITASTRSLLQRLDRKVEVLVFLEGENLPAPFQRLSNSTVDMLRRFRDISNNKVSYRVVDPLGSDTTALQILKKFRMTGVPVTFNEGKAGTSQKMIFPWVLVTMPDDKGNPVSYPVFLQEMGNTSLLNRQILLRSEVLLEYNLANGIHQLQQQERTKVRYLTGHGEQVNEHTYSLFVALAGYYDIDTLNLAQANQIPSDIRTLIINGPATAFSEQDKFKIDQYVMNGGNILWSLNTVTGNLDSLRSSGGSFNAMPIDLNLNDLLFNYGVRVNGNIIEDAVNHAMIPLGTRNSKGQLPMFHWIYFPVLNAGSDHIVVKNLNGVLARFVSSVDTNSSDPGIRKTVLLSSSKYSRIEAAPLPVVLESAIEEPNPAAFLKQNVPAAVLLEGNFTSLYATRKPLEVAALIDSLKLPVKTKAAKPGKMIVTGDADMLMNEYTQRNGPLEMGVFLYDQRFDNQTFLLNCMEYMNDPDNLLEARNKSFDNRILDPKVVEKERTKWQFINIGVPVIAILIFGSFFFFIRKRKYG